MPNAQALPVIAHAIQLAIAPVFLLTGVAALLGVMANRLSRVIDRGRALEEAWRGFGAEARAVARAELICLERRRKLASWSINFCTAAALLVCLVIVVLFLDEFFSANLRWVEGALFVLAMLAVIGGLTSFLREVYLATHTISLDPERFEVPARK
jgi:Fe2+ transport system protein B